MIFEDAIQINAPCEAVYSFFDRMDENYLRWRPEHIKFEWRKGKGLQEGNTFYFEEEISSQLLLGGQAEAAGLAIGDTIWTIDG